MFYYVHLTQKIKKSSLCEILVWSPAQHLYQPKTFLYHYFHIKTQSNVVD